MEPIGAIAVLTSGLYESLGTLPECKVPATARKCVAKDHCAYSQQQRCNTVKAATYVYTFLLSQR